MAPQPAQAQSITRKPYGASARPSSTHHTKAIWRLSPPKLNPSHESHLAPQPAQAQSITRKPLGASARPSSIHHTKAPWRHSPPKLNPSHESHMAPQPAQAQSITRKPLGASARPSSSPRTASNDGSNSAGGAAKVSHGTPHSAKHRLQTGLPHQQQSRMVGNRAGDKNPCPAFGSTPADAGLGFDPS